MIDNQNDECRNKANLLSAELLQNTSPKAHLGQNVQSSLDPQSSALSQAQVFSIQKRKTTISTSLGCAMKKALVRRLALVL